MMTALTKNQGNKIKRKPVINPSLNRHVIFLSYAGLLPFFALAIATFFKIPFAQAWFCIYSAIIVAFLAGNQWLSLNTATAYLYHSNALAIVAAMAIILHSFSTLASIMMLITAYFWLLMIEYKQGITGQYRTLRIRLSATVVSLHLIVLLA